MKSENYLHSVTLVCINLVLLILIHSAPANAQRNVNIPLNLKLNAVENSNAEAMLRLVVEGDVEEIKSFVEGAGGTFRSMNNQIAVINISSSLVRELAVQDFIKRIHYNFGRIGHALGDSMIVNNRVANVHNADSLFHRPYKGKGVLLGFIDSGIDFSHPDFQDSLGNTRILSIWDQAQDTLISSRIPRPYNYGQVWDSSSINANISTHDDDILSHGTNVAGVAVGNGSAVGKYVGVAPEADIIVVATDYSANDWLNTVADGVEYIFNYADSMKMPCVINISAGTYVGSHDGSDPAALRIDSMIKATPGRALVCAAGNLGTLPFHLGYTVNADTNFTWFRRNPSINALYYELWADTNDFKQVEFAFGADRVLPTYQFRGRTAFDQIQNRLSLIVNDSIVVAGNVLARLQTYAELVGDKYLLQVFFPAPDSNQYNFRFMTTGNGKFDLWSHQALGWSSMVNDNLPNVSTFPDIQFYKAPDTLKTVVSSFSCLPSVITVANYVNRDRYVDVNGVLQLDTALVGEDIIPGKIAANSCSGPTRTGLLKPDIAATGDFTLAANRLASIPLHIANNQANRIGEGGMHKRNGGTSMASPVVAGMAALYLEKCPRSSYADIYNALTTEAYQDGFTTTALPNMKWGHGKVDVSAALSTTNFEVSIAPAGDQHICDGDSLLFSAPSGFQSYLWNNADSTSSILLKEDQIITLKVENALGCAAYSDSLELIVNPLPPKPTVLVFSDTLISDLNATSYNWYFEGELLEGHDSLRIIDKNGAYVLEVLDSNGCSSFSDTLFINGLTTGVKDLRSNRPSFEVYPNPNDGRFVINSSVAIPATAEFFLTDITGKLISADVQQLSSQSRLISISNVEPGIYFLTSRNFPNFEPRKLIIE